MSFSFLKNPIARFLVVFGLLYLAWILLYEFVIHPWGRLDTLVINNSVFLTARLLELFGYESFTSTSDTIRTVGIDGTHGLWVGDPCNGLALFSLFICFVVAYPGPWQKKLWFIPLGLVLLHLINIIRITALCIIVLKRPEWLDFNHDYTFKILVYVFMFLLWMAWALKFSKKATS